MRAHRGAAEVQARAVEAKVVDARSGDAYDRHDNRSGSPVPGWTVQLSHDSVIICPVKQRIRHVRSQG
jgi:hypothetical protein